MKPYYQDEAVTIYHSDCRDILPTLKDIDLIITDPPYGISYNSGYYKYGNPHKPVVGDLSYPVEILNVCLRLATRAVFTFCRWDILHILPKPESVIVWVKNNWSAGDLQHEYGRMWEAIAFYPRSQHKFIGRPSDVIHCDRIAPTALTHPTEKPIPLLKQIIKANVGTTILDPFAGSGTTLMASKELGRRCIGIEIKEEYCETAALRCSQMVFDLDI